MYQLRSGLTLVLLARDSREIQYIAGRHTYGQAQDVGWSRQTKPKLLGVMTDFLQRVKVS